MPHMEAPKTPRKRRGRPELPLGQKLERGTIYLPADVWAKIDAAGLPALRKLLDRWRAPERAN